MKANSTIINSYRPLPFWSWNDKLNVEEIRHQVQEMHKAGLGGFFMHARGGLKTPYLSDEWMECVIAAIEEAKKLGLSPFLYDENGWPSGFGNGVVNGLGIKYQQKFLQWEFVDSYQCNNANTIAWYQEDGSFIGKELPSNYPGKVIHCFYGVNPYYVDNLDEDVVAKFLESTHEYYVKTLPKDLLPYLKGIFTDEPQLPREGFPWSWGVLKAYKEHCQRDLLCDLCCLFLDLPNSSFVRVSFWQVVTKLFRDSYIKQISLWCKKHDWILTGHHLAEECPLDQIPANGSLMAQYSSYDIPGTDHLCRIKPDLVVMKQLVSVANQLGKERILTESFGLAGWNLNFHGMHWIYHQQLTCGINLLCQHLSSYSLEGLRKRDYPGSYFIHQPWWKDYSVVNDHFAFAGAMIGCGIANTQLAIIHPLSTGWCNYNGDTRSKEANYYNSQLTYLTEQMMESFREFHFVDEIIFEEFGSVSDDVLKVGCCSYKVVIIPPLTNLSSKLFEELKRFSQNGGKIIVIQNDLEKNKLTIDGINADKESYDFFFNLEHARDVKEVVTLLDNYLLPTIKIYENNLKTNAFTGICRDIDLPLSFRKGKFYLIANCDYFEKHNVEIFLPDYGSCVEIISNDGRDSSVVANAKKCNGYWQISYFFAEGEGVMFFLPEDEKDSTKKIITLNDVYSLPVIKDISQGFTFTSIPNNLLLMDRCYYKFDDSDWIYDDVSVIHGRYLKRKKDSQLTMKFSFEIKENFNLDEDLYLIIERPLKYQFTFNDKPFIPIIEGILFDQAFKCIKLPKLLKYGSNNLTLTTVLHESCETWEILEKAQKFETEYNKLTFESEVENIYLYGNFTVQHQGEVEILDRDAFRFNGKFAISSFDIAKQVNLSNTILDGYPFFAGKMRLKNTFNLTLNEVKKIKQLRLNLLGANSVKVVINGVETSLLYTGTLVVNVVGLLKENDNVIEIELTSSLRNLLGPHHLAEGESYKVTTLSFSKEANAIGWQGPEFVEGYCCVGFGLSNLNFI